MAEVPEIVQLITRNNGGQNPRLFAEKEFTVFDGHSHQSRFLILQRDVKNLILPQLFEDEKLRANLVEGIINNTEGLPVELYPINQIKFYTLLKRRESKGLVLKGEWNIAAVFAEFKVGDQVQLWSFRKIQDNTLCLIICKRE